MTAQTGVEVFGTVSVAMVTPFKDNGEIDLETARRLASHLVDQGLDALVVSGTTGESPTTTVEEKLSLLREVKDEVGERARVMAGVGTNNTATTIEMAQASTDAGADSLLVVTPYYSKPNQEGVYRHFEAVAQATDTPICVYDIPGRTGTPVESETLRRLAKLPTIQGVKDAKGDMAAAAELISETGLAWFSGDDPLNLPWLSLGATGFISVIGHVAAPVLREIHTSFGEGDLVRARNLNATLTPLIRAQARLGGVSLAKAALRLQGLEVGDPRLPVVGVTDAQFEELRRDMQKAGVL